MSAALQNVTVIKLRGVLQKLLNISKVDGQRCTVVRGVVGVVKLLSSLPRNGRRSMTAGNVSYSSCTTKRSAILARLPKN